MKASSHIWQTGWAQRIIILVIALISLILAGFMASSHEPGALSSDGAIIDIEKLIDDVTALNKKGQHLEAIEFLIAALDKQPQDSLVRALLVQTFDAFLEQEIRDGQEAMAKNKRDIGSIKRLAGALELMGDNFRSMEVLLSGLVVNAKSTDIWTKIARLELKAERDLEALDIFKEIIRLDRKNSDALNNAAYILAQQNTHGGADLEEAYKLSLKAYKLDKKNPEYLDTLAEIQFRRGKHKEAIELIEKAIRLAPHHESFHAQLARFKDAGLNIK